MVSPLNITTAAPHETADTVLNPIEVLRPIELHPLLRPLSAGTPQTITLQIVPGTLIAHSSATAVVTATVVDIIGNPVSGVNLSGFITPSTRGPLGAMSATDANGQGTGIWTAGTAIGAGQIEVGDGVVSGTASIDLTGGAVISITVVPATTAVTAGLTTTFTANGADAFGNVFAITPVWDTNGGSIDATGVFTAQTNIAAGRKVTATADTVSGSAVVDVIARPLNSIVVLPNPATVTAGSTQQFAAQGFDQYNNAVSLTPAWTTNGGSINSSSGLFTAPTIVASGKRVTATQGITAGFALVNLQPAAPYTVTLQPSTAVISAGQRITFTAFATDIFGNSIGDVTSNTMFSITPASGGNFAANVVTPTVKSTWIVTGVDTPAVGTATLSVTAATFNRLAIEDAPAGSGSAVNAVTLNIANPLTVYAAAYDVYNNLIGSRNVTWGGTGVAAGNLAPPSGTSTTFTPVLSGTGTITAISSGITDTTGVITVQAPVLRISKTASPNPLTPGSPLQYTILYTNTGSGAAQNVMITETYPLSTSFFSAVPAPTSGTNVWSIGSLPANDNGSIVVFLTTASQMQVGSALTNSVRMSAAKVASAVYTATTSVNALPNLSASIIDNPDPARPGDLLNYTIQYRNDGTAFVTNVRVTETYPAQVSFVSAIPTPDIYPNVWLTNTLNGNGDSRTIVVTVRVNSPLSDTTILNNQVVVAAQEAPPYTTAEQTLIVAPDLHLTKSASSLTPAPNSPLTYTLFYTNSGSSYAANTIITDALPANTSYVTCQPIGCGVNGGIVTWNLNQLNQQTSGAATLTVQIANNLLNGTRITNTARITSTDRVADIAVLPITVTSAPDVTLSKNDGIATIAAGQVTTYTLSYANIGTAPASNVVITDRIPSNTAFVGCSACVAVGGGVYSFTLSTLNATQSGAVTLSTRLATTLPAGLRAITNTATIATSTAGDSPNNNSAQDADDISTRPVLSLSVAYDSRTPYPGKTITYTLHYTNTSAMDTTGVVITTTRPAWLASPPPGWTPIGAIDLRSVGNLGAGQSGTVTYVLTLPPSYTLNMTAFVSTFTIQDDGPGGLPVAQAQSTTSIGVPDLSIAQVIVPSTVAPGQKFTATVIISNSGLGRACNPSNCAGFYLDAFVDPATTPPSYPYVSDGFPYTGVPPVNANTSITIVVPNLVFLPAQQPRLYFKIDNFNCSPIDGSDPCLPSHSLGGLVPEYNEDNNVAGPILVPRYAVYLPLMKKH